MTLNSEDEARISKISQALCTLASEQLPTRLDVVADDRLGEVERHLNDVILSHEHRFQERLLFSIGPVVVFRWRNVEGWPVEYVSPNVIELTGYSAEQYLTSEQVYALHIPKEDLPRVMSEVQTYSASGKNWFVHEPYRLLRKDGKYLWISDYSVIRRDERGDITHYIGYIFDITDRMEAANELARKERAIRKLASPILHIWDGILAVPLSGIVDQTLATDMTARLLDEVSRSSAKYTIIDLTGLESIDATTMEHLFQVVRAVGLLGSTCILSGISPKVARAIIELGLQISGLAAFGTLRAALEHALEEMGKSPRGKRAKV